MTGQRAVRSWRCGVSGFLAGASAAADLGDQVAYVEIDTSEPGAVAKWGVSDAVYVDGREVRSGPLPSYERIRSIIAKRLRV